MASGYLLFWLCMQELPTHTSTGTYTHTHTHTHTPLAAVLGGLSERELLLVKVKPTNGRCTVREVTLEGP